MTDSAHSPTALVATAADLDEYLDDSAVTVESFLSPEAKEATQTFLKRHAEPRSMRG